MNLVLNLPPETEAKLKEQAAAIGKPPEEVALRALEARLRASARPKRRSRRRRKLSPEEWAADIEKWAESHHHGVSNADDSRESICEGRGMILVDTNVLLRSAHPARSARHSAVARQADDCPQSRSRDFPRQR